ncbi:MAG: OmpA family protein [Rhizobacter sp.]
MNKTHFPFAAVLSLLAAAGSMPALAADATVQKVTVRAVTHFDFDKASLSAEEQTAILADVSKMKDVTWQTVNATGHTDSVGAAGYNKKLAERRADVVRAYLLAKGLSPDMINVAAKASNAPVASNDTDQGRAQNRRTEIEFQGVRAATP